jgi:hypothetical protein
MKNWPTDPMRQHNRFIAALCDDFAGGHFSLLGGKAERVAEISRQVNSRSAPGMPLSENNEDCSRPKAGSPTAAGGDAQTEGE